ncbi:conserved hypothetical protein [Pediculus humanus corporis]|uniref:gamma-glutamylcyclotransferase n=1 Tax=Pediculus humanus subsp. corporis TaxID=121224 RepID=E0VAM3_PEDHC|nr:uncharacterized protein Phum_PHUM041020 [Pediculus humanus corporis]EEB10429.1 conserved hypothetical protein [Pediculus humanus corporis]
MSGKQLQTFLYFAYGSNLLGQRILLQNPTAVRRGIGKLNDHRLDFNYYSKRWGGCSATVVPHVGKHVWGAVWEIDKSQMDNLDKQEGVDAKIYEAVQVDVVSGGHDNNEILDCRVYKLLDQPDPYETASKLPESRRPSRVYLETILQGAIESKLPNDYFDFLKCFPHNGFSGPVEVPGLNITFTEKWG